VKVERFKVAHIREQGVDLIIVFVNSSVAHVLDSEKAQLLGALQLCANSAGLRGSAVLVWEGGFYADQRFHAFFRSAPYATLAANINGELTCENM